MITEIETHYGMVQKQNLTRVHVPTERSIHRLVDELKREPRLLASRITPEGIAALLHTNRAVAFGTCSNSIHAFCALWSCKDPSWLELGTMFITETYRHRRVAQVLFQICDNLCPERKLFPITAEPAVVVLAIKNGWRLEGNNWNGTGTFPWEEVIIGPLWERYPPSCLKEPGLLLYRKARPGKVVCWSGA